MILQSLRGYILYTFQNPRLKDWLCIVAPDFDRVTIGRNDYMEYGNNLRLEVHLKFKKPYTAWTARSGRKVQHSTMKISFHMEANGNVITYGSPSEGLDELNTMHEWVGVPIDITHMHVERYAMRYVLFMLFLVQNLCRKGPLGAGSNVDHPLICEMKRTMFLEPDIPSPIYKATPALAPAEYTDGLFSYA